MPGSSRSAAYKAFPETFSGPSSWGTGWPMAEKDVIIVPPLQDDTGAQACACAAQRDRHCIHSATRSAIMIVVALVLERVTLGMIEASTTRKPWIPCTRPYWSTTAMWSDAGPILHVPDVWCALPAVFNSQASSAASEAKSCAVGARHAAIMPLKASWRNNAAAS